MTIHSSVISGAATSVLFVLGCVFVVRPLQFRFRGVVWTLDFMTAPLAALVAMRFFDLVSWGDIWRGLIGCDGLQPLAIITIFFSLAYSSISVDMTGVLEAFALWALRRAGKSRVKVFVLLFLLSSALTVFTSNDIVILTVTPIVCYFCAKQKSDPKPYLYTQFAAANVWSTLLLIGNPTNIIAGKANNIDFIDYSRTLALPGTVAGLTVFATLYLLFFRTKPTLQQHAEDEEEVLGEGIQEVFDETILDPFGAKFGVAMLAVCLALLVTTSWTGLPLWVCTLAVSVVMATRDLFVQHVSRPKELVPSGLESVSSLPPLVDPDNNASPDKQFMQRVRGTRAAHVVAAVPWGLTPFVLSMFCLVEALNTNGILDHIATVLRVVATLPVPVVPTVALMMLCAVVVALMNNQPATILLTRAMLLPAFKDALVSGDGGAKSYRLCVDTLILASNFGANLTPVGALAGLMWLQILEKKGVSIQWSEFMFSLGRVILPAMVTSSVTLWLIASVL
eukprot:PhM_4_TR12533/c0_g1_i1/m.17234